MKKKLLLGLLIFCMGILLMPTNALADEAQNSGVSVQNEELGGGTPEASDTTLDITTQTQAQEKAWELINSYADPAYFMYDPYVADMTSEEYQVLKNAAESAIAGSNSQLEKMSKIVQLVASKVYYDFPYYEGTSTQTYANPYDIYTQERTVCAGYARLVRTLCISVGIPCMDIVGDEHEYNAMYNSETGNWVFADATWCSGNKYNGEGSWTPGACSMSFFNLAPEELARLKNHEVYYIEGLLYGDVYYKAEFSNDAVTWSDLSKVTLSVVGVKEGVTSVTLADRLGAFTVNAIDTLAFWDNTTIQEINLSNMSLKTLNGAAFHGCTALTKVTLPAALQTIEHQAFQGCTALETITIPSTVTEIGNNAFDGCTALKTLDLSKTGITRLTEEMLIGCSSLETILFPNTITSMGARVFESCTALENVDMSTTSITTLESSSFRYCSNLSTVVLPATLTNLNFYAFTGCDALTQIDLSRTQLTTLPNSMFSGKHNLKTVLLPATIETIGEQTFLNCTSLESIDLSHTAITEIGSSTFYGCAALTSVELPTALTSIGASAFNGCEELKAINLEETAVTIIDGNAFENCSSLTTVVLPSTVETLGQSAFTGCDALSYIDMSKTKIDTLISYMFAGNTTLKTVVLPNTLELIEDNTFNGCISLETIDMSNTSLTSIEYHAFNDCSSITEVTLPATLTTLAGAAFENCFALKTVDLSKTQITEWPMELFCECVNIETIHFPSTLESFERWSLKDCTELTTLDLSGTKITTLKAETFYHCPGISYLKLPSTLETIEARAFYDCYGLQKVDLSETKLTTIQMGLVNDCIALTELLLPSTLTSIEYGGLSGLSSLEKIDLSHTQITELDDIALSGGSSLKTIILPDTLETMGQSVFSDCVVLKAIDLSNTKIKELGVYAFANCTALNSIKLPAGMTTLGSGAFQNCTSLKKVDMPSSLTTIEAYCFYNSALNELDLSQTQVSTIGGSAFQNLSALTVIKLPGTITSIGSNAFAVDDIRLDTIVITPLTVTQLNSGAWNGRRILVAEYLYTVHFSANGGEGSMQTLTYGSNNSYQLPVGDFYREGYEFLGWNTKADGSGRFYGEGETVRNLTSTPNGKVTLYAQWKVMKYTITYHSAEGYMTNTENPKEYDITQTIKLKNPTKTGYIFKGWYGEPEFKNRITTIRTGSIGDMDLYAKWVLQPYDVVYHLDGGTNNSKNPNRYYMQSNRIDLEAPTKKGYHFSGWYSDANFTNGTPSIMPYSTGELHFYAKWILESYRITYELDYGINNENNPTSYSVNSGRITLKKPTKKGYTFVGWYSDAGYKNKVTEIPANSTGDVKLYARWKLTNYTINYVLNGGKNSGKNPSKYNFNSGTIYLENPTRKGCTFEGWYTDKNFKNRCFKIDWQSTGNKTFYAKWKTIEYYIDYQLDGGTNSSKNPYHYTVETDTIKLKKPTKKGHTFVGWYTDAKLKKEITEIKKGSAGHKTLYAGWRLNKYNIKFDGNGATSGKMKALTNRKYGKAYTLTANAFKRTGYKFIGWNTKADGSGKFYDDKDKVKNLSSKDGKTITLYAQWKKVKYTIKYELNGGKNNSKNPSKYYVTTDTFKLKNPTRKGYVFKGWYTDKNFKHKITKVTKGSTGNLKLYAKWVKK